jgi:hypothetical protein
MQAVAACADAALEAIGCGRRCSLGAGCTTCAGADCGGCDVAEGGPLGRAGIGCEYGLEL